jgi:hypothetical protein
MLIGESTTSAGHETKEPLGSLTLRMVGHHTGLCPPQLTLLLSERHYQSKPPRGLTSSVENGGLEQTFAEGQFDLVPEQGRPPSS